MNALLLIDSFNFGESESVQPVHGRQLAVVVLLGQLLQALVLLLILATRKNNLYLRVKFWFQKKIFLKWSLHIFTEIRHFRSPRNSYFKSALKYIR